MASFQHNTPDPIKGPERGLGPQTVRFSATADQTWAVDSDYLHKRLAILKPFGRHFVNRIKMLDILCDVMLVAAVLSVFLIGWWLFVPLVGFACLQHRANSRMTGEMAARAAQESTDAFLYLYNSGALWLD